jgi:hypothetical protein
MNDAAPQPAGLDLSVSQPARRYDAWSGGKDNFAADRASAQQVEAVFPSIKTSVAQFRAFVRRAVHHLAGLGVTQYGWGRLQRGKTRRTRDAVAAEITTLCKDTWVRRILHWELAGDTPSQLRLSWTLDEDARTALEDELFGKRILVTNRDTWPITDVVAAYRSQSDAEFGFRQLKDPTVVSFSPMHHSTDQAIRVHVYTCVLALQISRLMRRQTAHAALNLSVRELLTQLAGIQETVLVYPSTAGRPKTRRQLTETSPQQQKLAEVFDLHRWAPQT